MYAFVFKANPYHDERGRFSTESKAKSVSPWGSSSSSSNVVESKGADGSEWVEFRDKEGRGSLMMSRSDGGAFQVRESEVSVEQRGKGIGKSLYKAAMAYARRRKVDLTSDLALSESANGVWESLKREGYPVQRQPFVKLENGKYRSYRQEDFGGVRVDIPTGVAPWRFKGSK